ncbi:hypothetical protein OIU84_004644 [Salix udensis]|uniref:Uncharacterized protein n=1 Tax=Salix udensis TaxID=889485 RepID=A0AAD6K4V2_9ROSI|nr:hypothetical protein OIU84_004644 [Salix udensis]
MNDCPVRAVIQVLFSEQTKLDQQMNLSGSFSETRSPYLGFEAPTRCLSKREMSEQQVEEKKKGFFRWKKFGNVMPSMKSNNVGVVDKIEGSNEGEGEGDAAGSEMETPVDLKTRLVRGKNKINSG